MTIGDETRKLKKGDAYIVPPTCPRPGGDLADQIRMLEVFSPPREDLVKQASRPK